MSEFCRATSVSPWTRRVAGLVTALTAGTIVGISPVQATEPDVTAPILFNATVTADVIDVVDGPVDVTLRIEAEDLGSGINPASFTVDPDPDYGYGRDPVKAKVMTLVSGDHNRGIYEATFTFPELIANGDWTYNAVIRDNAGNANYDYNGSATFGVLGRTTTVQSSPDREAPVVTTDASTRLIDVTDGPASLKFTAEAHDPGIGIAVDETITLGNGTWGGGYYVKNSSTDPHSARFEANIVVQRYTVQQDPRGTFSLYFSGVTDANGNASPATFAGTYTVGTRPFRGKRPNLVVEGTNLKASWTSQTDPLGILEYEVEVKSSEQTKTVKTTTLEVVHADLPAGTYTAQVRARNQLGWGEWTTPSEPVVYSLGSLTTSTPSISGAVKVGQTLTANPGIWTPGATLAYQWLAGGVAVSGATAPTLVLGPGQAGKTIAVRVTGSKAGYTTASKTSAVTATVANGVLKAATPTIAGTARVGSMLTASPGIWSPAPVTISYQWYRSGAAIAGATASTYNLTTTDLGKQITVTATGRKSGYNAAVRSSLATVPIATGFMTAPTPTVPASTTVKIGQILSVKTGVWAPTGVVFSYQWKRNGTPISGALSASYKVVSADRGSTLSVTVTGRKSGYVTKAVTSRATGLATW